MAFVAFIQRSAYALLHSRQKHTSLESTSYVKLVHMISRVTNSNLEATLVKILPEGNRLLIRSTVHTVDLTFG
jgi:hypothetical protein